MLAIFHVIVMLHNIKTIPLHRVFHGIRFKVNEDWESGKIPSFFACLNTELLYTVLTIKRLKWE